MGKRKKLNRWIQTIEQVLSETNDQFPNAALHLDRATIELCQARRHKPNSMKKRFILIDEGTSGQIRRLEVSEN